MIGITLPRDESPYEITAKVSAISAPYIKSKPIINNQEIIKENEDGSIVIRFRAYNTYELKQNLLGFGAAIKVLKPKVIVDEMREIFEKGLQQYIEATNPGH